MEDFGKFKGYLAPFFEEDKGTEQENADEVSNAPVADEYLLQSVYEGIREAAESVDGNAIEEILKELSDYQILGKDGEKIAEIRKRTQNFDYDGILELLDK